jgi:hypothetical protein
VLDIVPNPHLRKKHNMQLKPLISFARTKHCVLGRLTARYKSEEIS